MIILRLAHEFHQLPFILRELDVTELQLMWGYLQILDEEEKRKRA